MMRTLAPRFATPFRLILSTLILLSSAIGGSAVYAAPQMQSVPDACLNPNGNPVDLQYDNAQGLVLNFNHALSTVTTISCIVSKFTDAATGDVTISYATMDCDLINNVDSIEVGNPSAPVGLGVAPFDGNFHVECPNPFMVEPWAENQFYMYGHASIDNSLDGTYYLVNHPSVGMRATVVANTTATLQSRYDTASFSTVAPIVNPNQTQYMRIGSRLKTTNIVHTINGNLSHGGSGAYFNYDYSAPIIIGESDNPWELHYLIIDPPTGYS